MNSQNDFDGIFKDKIIFVTGHTGFVGSWLTLWLHSLGARIIGYSLEPPTHPSLFEALGLEKEIIHVVDNILDFASLHECMKKHQPEMIFHLAAQPLVRESYNEPIETFETNIMGTVNVLESVRNVPSVKTCIVMTSDKCYENLGISYSYKETDPMGGHDPYSASKGAAELVVSSYRRSFFDHFRNDHYVGISTIRAGNVIGGGDWAEDRIVPDCIRSLMEKKSIPIRNPGSVRPWQYVLEPIYGILLLTLKMSKNPAYFSQPWNLGPQISSRMLTVSELVNQIISEWGEGDWIDVSSNSNEFHESSFLLLDSSKAINSLGWFPVYSVKEAIHETISWYRNYLDGKADMRELTLNQIGNYSNKITLLRNEVKEHVQS